MRNTVKLSTFCVVLTLLTSALIVAMFFYFMMRQDVVVTCVMGACITLWAFATLFYLPLSISVSDSAIEVHRSLATRRIPLADVRRVILCPPTMGERRLCGSGGFCGYWGWFSQRDIGRYFAYYGKASDCFLVELRNGRKYLLGCENAPAMVEAIKARMARS